MSDESQMQLDLEQITQLEPLVQEFFKEPLSDQARKAQALTLTFSTVAVSVGLGLVQINKIAGGGADIVILGNSATLVATGLSLFFLVRFLLYYSRDEALFKWAKGRAALGIKIFFHPMEVASTNGTIDSVARRYAFSQESFYNVIGVIERSARHRKQLDFVFPIALWIAAFILLLWSVRNAWRGL